jgi:hypothetical protein
MTKYGSELELAKGLLECIPRTEVEYGRIEITDRSAEAILAEFVDNLQTVVDQSEAADIDFRFTIDHLGDLLERARIEAVENREEIAITLYATWLEHFINGLLIRTLSRRGLEYARFKTLIRELRLATKAGALWELAGLPLLDDADIRLVEHVGGLRNAFVHYKWQSPGEDDQGRQESSIRQAIEDLERLIVKLMDIEHVELWCGRRDELVSVFRGRFPQHEGDASVPK